MWWRPLSTTVVQPIGPCPPVSLHHTYKHQLLKKKKLRVLAVIGNWFLWAFATILIFGQFLGNIWTTAISVQHVQFGQSPDRGLYQVAGESDEPYTDRSFVCSLHGRVYKPRSVQKAIEVASTAGMNTSDSGIDGYRMVSRNQFEFGLEVYRMYSNVCDIVAAKLDTIVHICTALGYNVTIDKLRIAPDVNSKDIISLSNTLPVVILPYYDNSQFSRCAIPRSDGSACIFHLIDTPHREAYSIVRVVSRVARATWRDLETWVVRRPERRKVTFGCRGFQRDLELRFPRAKL